MKLVFFFVFFWFFLPGCAEQLSIPDKFYAAPGSFVTTSEIKEKQTNNIKTRSYFMCHMWRSWYVKKAKTDRDLSAKHEGQ